MGTFYMILFPVLFMSMLFYKAKMYGRGEWNDEFLSLKQTKALQGFCAVGIMFHHMGQKTCAYWLNPEYIIPGLNFFVPIGYLFVGFFLFSSGYGLYKGLHTKENYCKRFLGKHIGPILFTWAVTECIFYIQGGRLSPYTWYIYAILYLYFLYYLAFRFIKREWISLGIVLTGIIFYSWLCDFFVLGTWWYNTVGVFFVGMVIAKFEKYLIPFLKKWYILIAIADLSALLVLFFVSERWNYIYPGMANEMLYRRFQIGAVTMQFCASVAFVMLLLMFNLKVKVGNKALSFTGQLTLEIYLVHGFFVQLFGYSFVEESVKSLYYIKIIPLYVGLVLVLGIGSAWIIHTIWRKLCEFLSGENKYKDSLKKDFKRVCLGLLVILAIYTVYLTITENIGKKAKREAAMNYCRQNITFIEIDEKKMAAYVAGTGKDTIILMRGYDDACPTLSLRATADELAKDYKVIVLDYFGSGFSDDTRKERTAENITQEVHEAVQKLGVDTPYILMPEYISGLYAQYYVNKYPDEVKAVVAIDMDTNLKREQLWRNKGIYYMEYKRKTDRNCTLSRLAFKAMDMTGLKKIVWPNYEWIYQKGLGEENMDVAYSVFFDRIYSENAIDEIKHEYDSFILTKNLKYPKEVQVVDIYSVDKKNYYRQIGIDPEKSNAMVCTSSKQYTAVTVNNCIYCLCNNVETIPKILEDKLK